MSGGFSFQRLHKPMSQTILLHFGAKSSSSVNGPYVNNWSWICTYEQDSL